MAFDLDKVIAEEETKPPWPFTFGGEQYELPGTRDLRAIVAISAGRLDSGIKLLLGPEQWQRIQDSPALLTTDALRALLDAYSDYIDGLTAGESSASSTRSTSTARPSKRTSKGSTRSRSRK